MGSFYLVRDSLSNIQFYYTPPELIQESSLIISGEEVKHIARVMRNEVGDSLYVTDGLGNSYRCKVERIDKKLVHCSIQNKQSYKNNFVNLTVCIPRLKSNDRFEMALEKCVELGITKFIVYESERTIGKGDKSERWLKILLAAMKQCQRTFLPKVSYAPSVKKLNEFRDHKILFEQESDITLEHILVENKINLKEKYVLVFGPEGGFSNKEIDSIEDKTVVNMNTNRLRSETAIISAVAIITYSFTSAR